MVVGVCPSRRRALLYARHALGAEPEAGGPNHERKARGVGAAIIRDLEKQMNEDIPIWEHKKYFDKPLLCDGDGKFGIYRKWMRQFFSEEW